MSAKPDPSLVRRDSATLRRYIANRAELIVAERAAVAKAQATLDASVDHLAELARALEAVVAREARAAGDDFASPLDDLDDDLAGTEATA